MAVKFEFYESPNTIGTRKKRYHARVVNRERISTDHLAQEIHHSSSLTVADIKQPLSRSARNWPIIEGRSTSTH